MKRLKRILSMLLVCCMVFTCLPITARAADKGGIYDGAITEFEIINFYEAVGVSQNKNFEVRGIAIDSNGNAWCVIASTQRNGNDHGFTKVSINNDNGMYEVENPHYKRVIGEKKNPAKLTLKFPDGKTELVNAETKSFSKGTELYCVGIGKEDDIALEFRLSIESSDPGWNILDVDIEIKMDYNIIKLVNDKENIEYEELPDDRALKYTIKVTHNGDHPVYDIDVYDNLPECLEIKRITAQVLAPEEDKGALSEIEPVFGEDGRLLLDSELSMSVGFEKEYTIYTVVKDDYKDGTIVNTATIEGPRVLDDEAQVMVYNDFFYVHHIHNDGQVDHENGVEKRVDKIKINKALRDGAKFNVTAAGGGKDGDGNDIDAKSLVQEYPNIDIEDATKYTSGDYKGLLSKTLYGGTFDKSEEKDAEGNVIENGTTTYTVPYQFAAGENGIGFTPKADKHYYVWEPINYYLRPFNIAVWHHHTDAAGKILEYHTIAGYPLAAVDRVNYKQFGFNDRISSAGIYDKVIASKNFDGLDTDTYTAQKLGLTGFLGCDKFDPGVFDAPGNSETFLPYWVTVDGVKVTAVYKRIAEYKGVGSDISFKEFEVTDIGNTYPVENYDVPGSQTLLVSAMFEDNNLEHPVSPEIPEKPASELVNVDFKKVTIGASQNIKALKLTFDLSEFDYDRAWFEVNGELLEAQDMNGVISAMTYQKGSELTIVPCWSYGEETFSGTALILNVTKNSVEKITPVAVSRMAAAPFRASVNLDENSIGVILQ